MKAKKSYGQHFLNNEGLAARIADSLALAGQAYERVIEVGPGQGMLTQFLLGKSFDLLVVEADQVHAIPDPDFVFEAGQHVVLFGELSMVPEAFGPEDEVVIDEPSVGPEAGDRARRPDAAEQ